MTPRHLTHDERKAAEAAFAGRPFNPRWSQAARMVYDGILTASGLGAAPIEPPTTDLSVPKEASVVRSGETTPGGSLLPAPSQNNLSDAPDGEPKAKPSQLAIRSRAEAIQAGLLIDVTPLAQQVGLPLPVGITKPLWDIAITASHALPEDQYEARMRDVLMALRLRLSTTKATIPWIEFPVLLAFPPDTIPQLCVLHAVAHEDPTAAATLTLALRDEVSPTIAPLSNN